MVGLDTVRALLKYSDWANEEIVRCAAPLSDEQLDEPIEMGLGSLRKTLAHIYHGEHVWLQRWKGAADTPWPPYGDPVTAPQLTELFQQTWQERDAFLDSLSQSDLERTQVYRDSVAG